MKETEESTNKTWMKETEESTNKAQTCVHRLEEYC